MSIDPRYDPLVNPQPTSRLGPSLQEGEWASSGSANTGEGLNFWDFLDVVNPLQHIPGVAQVYRAVTGDEISGPARILGGTLYGGPIGLVTSAVQAIVEEVSGDSLEGHALAALEEGYAYLAGDKTPEAETAQLASTPAAPEEISALSPRVPAPAPQAEEAASIQVSSTVTIHRTPPPPESFMALGANAFTGPRVQSAGSHRIDPEIATASRRVAERNLYQTSKTADTDAPAAISSPEDAFTARMMDALIRYQALSEERLSP